MSITDRSEGALVVKPSVAWRMLSVSNTRGYQLLAKGELVSFRDGRSRKITVASIHQYISRHLAEASDKRGRGRPRKIPLQPVATVSGQPEAQT
jgi:hypothetical protein